MLDLGSGDSLHAELMNTIDWAVRFFQGAHLSLGSFGDLDCLKRILVQDLEKWQLAPS